jgi:alkylhydroperoxidase family enzyme
MAFPYGLTMMRLVNSFQRHHLFRHPECTEVNDAFVLVAHGVAFVRDDTLRHLAGMGEVQICDGCTINAQYVFVN